MIFIYIEWCRDDVFLWANPEVGIALVPSTKSLWDFFYGFWIIAKYNLCGKHKFMILLDPELYPCPGGTRPALRYKGLDP